MKKFNVLGSVTVRQEVAMEVEAETQEDAERLFRVIATCGANVSMPKSNKPLGVLEVTLNQDHRPVRNAEIDAVDEIKDEVSA